MRPHTATRSKQVTQATLNSNRSANSKLVSIKDLFSKTQRSGALYDLPQESYAMPKYSWSKPKFSEIKEKRFDYITTFNEPVHPDLNLIKIHSKKKHDVPGPQAYDTIKKWTKVATGEDPRKG